jgi:fermentation-respiration switch protein FrsA (DUF1100 family)
LTGVTVLKILGAALAGYLLVVCPYFYLMQDNILFARVGISPLEVARMGKSYPGAEEIYISAHGGVRLHGWLLRNEAREPSPLLIYFGGNAEEVSGMLGDAERHLKGWSVLLINYRGYGLSGGRPSQKDLFADAEVIYDAFASRGDIAPGMMVPMGRSLGSGVAVHLSSVRPVRGVVLVSPYDSITAVAKGKLPFLPVRLLLRHPFDSLRKAPSIEAPMLALVAAEDGIIPPEHSRRLVEAWGGPRTIREIRGVGHNEIGRNPQYWESIRGFLRGLENEQHADVNNKFLSI